MESTKRKPGSRRKCSFGSCDSSKTRNSDLILHGFPNRSHESERRKKWISIIRKSRNDFSWTPTMNSRVCEKHFSGGKKSNNPLSKAYYPSLDPFCHLEEPEEETINNFNTVNVKEEIIEDEIREPRSTAEMSCQTDDELRITEFENDVINFMFCAIDKNDSCIQTDLSGLEALKETYSKHSQTDFDITVNNVGFVGRTDINDEEKMKEMCGISVKFFNTLLELIILGKDGQPSYYKMLTKENRLLLFLIKFKLGLSFCTLGCLFSIHRTVASTIFHQILKTLILKTQTWIVWPNRETVRASLPKPFQKYPNSRCIIDLTEIPVGPRTMEHKMFFHSNERNKYTAKFLLCTTPNGLICKVSSVYGGKCEDSFIINDCEFVKQIEPDDYVLADKELPQIKAELEKRKVTLVVPPFAFDPLLEPELSKSLIVAPIRRHVEQAIQRIRSFQILNFIQADLLSSANEIIHMCCVLVNSDVQPL